MTSTDLAQEIEIEFEAIQMTIDQLASLYDDVGQREPTVRELAASGLFLANFYNGIENVLKRICRFQKVLLPASGDWHVELAKWFSDPPYAGLPLLLDDQLANDLAPYRQFRHVIHHGYGFRLLWSEMLPGVEAAGDVFARFRRAVERYRHDLPVEPQESE